MKQKHDIIIYEDGREVEVPRPRPIVTVKAEARSGKPMADLIQQAVPYDIIMYICYNSLKYHTNSNERPQVDYDTWLESVVDHIPAGLPEETSDSPKANDGSEEI